MRFRNKVKDYHHSVAELQDVLSEEEILKLQGDSFERARRLFLFYFGLTNILYIILGTVAYLIMQFFWELL